MMRSVYRWLAASSLLLTALVTAQAQTRPQYGGTLHVMMRTAPTSLDPADTTQSDSFARRNLTSLIFDTLITVDESGHLHPVLATSWQAASGNQRWQLHIRKGIKFHDGAALAPEIVASSLRAANPAWTITSDADSITIQCDANPNLPAELALRRNAIVEHSSDGKPNGTGPFRITDWQPGKKLSLAANEDYWNGRPYLDIIEIEMGRNFHDQQIALELGRADLIEVAPEQSHRLSLEGRRVTSSSPMELVALLFTSDLTKPEDKLLREALALSIDRNSIRSVLLQGAGQPTAGVLPTSMSGYGFVFPTEADLARARREREQVRAIPIWTLGYDPADQIARILAERIALNARDAGLAMQPSNPASPDIRLVRIPLADDPQLALAQISTITGAPKPKLSSNSIDDLYAAEQSLLNFQRLIPLVHLPVVFATSPAVHDWVAYPDGSWDLANIWVGKVAP